MSGDYGEHIHELRYLSTSPPGASPRVGPVVYSEAASTADQIKRVGRPGLISTERGRKPLAVDALKATSTITTLALMVLTAACLTDRAEQPVERADSTPVVERVWPDSWPVPPLPIMALEHPDGPVWGSPSTYCWHLQDESDRVCHEYTFWTGLDAYPEAVPDEQIRVRVDSETKPDKMFAQVYTRHGNIMVDFIQLGTTYPVLDLDLDPGDYHIRLIGQWQYNETTDYTERRYDEVSYEFGLSVPGTVDLLAGCASTLIGGDLSIVLSSLDDRLRTAVDSANSGGCRFNKPIASISLTLDSDDSSPYTETFTVEPPSLTVGFPLPEDLVSEKTGGPLPPGKYSRRIVAVAEDGDEWDFTDYDLLQDTVTIVER